MSPSEKKHLQTAIHRKSNNFTIFILLVMNFWPKVR